MADQEPTTQKTQPRPRKKGKLPEPIDIPIPTKRDVFSDLAKTARNSPSQAVKRFRERRRRMGKNRP